jgi:hypothetical protein
LARLCKCVLKFSVIRLHEKEQVREARCGKPHASEDLESE